MGILANAQAVLLITLAEAQRVAHLLRAQVDVMHTVITPQELTSSTHVFIKPPLQPQDVAFLPYTSGSTGQPKAWF